jgi:hypothetical protein
MPFGIYAGYLIYIYMVVDIPDNIYTAILVINHDLINFYFCAVARCFFCISDSAQCQ